MRFRTILLAAVVSSALATPALAHRQWILPSTTTVGSTNQSITFDAAVSNDLFHPDHMPMDPAAIKVEQSDGAAGTIDNPAKGRYRGTFDVAINKPGTWKIFTDRSGISGSFKLNGEDWRVGGRRPNMGANRPGAASAPTAAPAAPKWVASVDEIPAGATDLKLTEIDSEYAVYVSSGAPTKTVLTPTGKGLEFDPITQPNGLASDEEAQFRFLIDGKPAAGLKVELVPGSKKYRSAEEAQELTTDAQGIITIKWPVAGMYWLSASAQDTKPSDKRATDRRMSFGTTLEVVAP